MILSTVEAWAFPFVAAAYGIATVINAIFHPVGDWLPMLFAGAFVGFATYWGMRAILRFQKVNALTMRRETFEGFIWFFVGFSVLFASLIFLGVAISGGSNLAVLYGLAIPAGMSTGAARQWELRKHFRSRGTPAV